MITAEQIPDEVWEAFHEAVQKYGYGPHAIAAALNAWPNAKTLRNDGRRQTYIVPALILPLPQQVRDE